MGVGGGFGMPYGGGIVPPATGAFPPVGGYPSMGGYPPVGGYGPGYVPACPPHY